MALHWQIPFVSLNETAYVINIYDANYTGSPVTLMGGAQPFVTSEDDNTDIFTLLRAQTGYINVIDEDGTLMEQMMPTSATSHYVEVKSGDTIHWQGFLTDEAYSQAWDNQPKEINVAVRSVLGVMEAITIPADQSNSRKTIAEIIEMAIAEVSKFTPTNAITSVIYPQDSPKPLNALLVYLTNFYDYIKQMNDGRENTSVAGNSLASVISAVCAFAGWECREYGTKLYFSTVDSVRNKTSKDLTSLIFVSNSHNAGYTRGARSIEVNASVNKMEGSEFINISLPEVLTASGITEINKSRGYYVNADWQIQFTNSDYTTAPRTMFYMLAQTNAYMAQNIGFSNSQYLLCRNSNWVNSIQWSGGPIDIPRMLQWIGLFESSDSTFLWTRSAMVAEFNFAEYWDNTQSPRTRYTGGFFAKLDLWKDNVPHTENKPSNGMYLCAIPPYFNPPTGRYDYIMEMSSQNFVIGKGYYNIQFSGAFINPYGVTDNVSGGYITLALKHGNRWWNGTEWGNSFATFNVNIDTNGTILTNRTPEMPVAGNQGWYVPTEEGNSGIMTLYFMMKMSVLQTTSYVHVYQGGREESTVHCYAWDVFVRTLAVEFLSTSTYKINDNSENTYFKLLDMNSTEAKNVPLALATDNNNKEGFGIVRNADLTKPTTWPYYTGTGTATKDQRPELHLLDRMATYYSKVRRWLKVKVQHPEDILPLTRYTHNGITYAPVAESRNWRDDESELTLTEIPT